MFEQTWPRNIYEDFFIWWDDPGHDNRVGNVWGQGEPASREICARWRGRKGFYHVNLDYSLRLGWWFVWAAWIFGNFFLEEIRRLWVTRVTLFAGRALFEPTMVTCKTLPMERDSTCQTSNINLDCICFAKWQGFGLYMLTLNSRR